MVAHPSGRGRTSSLFRVAEANDFVLTPIGEGLQIVLRLLGPLFLALAQLAVRGRVKRGEGRPRGLRVTRSGQGVTVWRGSVQQERDSTGENGVRRGWSLDPSSRG